MISNTTIDETQPFDTHSRIVCASTVESKVVGEKADQTTRTVTTPSVQSNTQMPDTIHPKCTTVSHVHVTLQLVDEHLFLLRTVVLGLRRLTTTMYNRAMASTRRSTVVISFRSCCMRMTRCVRPFQKPMYCSEK